MKQKKSEDEFSADVVFKHVHTCVWLCSEAYLITMCVCVCEWEHSGAQMAAAEANPEPEGRGPAPGVMPSCQAWRRCIQATA